MVAIITNMRSFARARGEMLTSITPRVPVKAALSFFQEQFRIDEIQLQFTHEQDLPMIKADPQKVEQIVVNFLSNARYAVEEKATSVVAEYQKKVDVRLFCDQAQQMVILEVEDNGTGMSSDVLNHCLEPFYTTKKVGEGTGLGLVIVHNLIKEFNGTLEIKAREGLGTCFQVLFPIEDEKKNPQTAVPE